MCHMATPFEKMIHLAVNSWEGMLIRRRGFGWQAEWQAHKSKVSKFLM